MAATVAELVGVVWPVTALLDLHKSPADGWVHFELHKGVFNLETKSCLTVLSYAFVRELVQKVASRDNPEPANWSNILTASFKMQQRSCRQLSGHPIFNSYIYLGPYVLR